MGESIADGNMKEAQANSKAMFTYIEKRERGERERFAFHSQEYSGHSTRFFSLKKLAMGIGRLSLPGTARGKDIGMALASRG